MRLCMETNSFLFKRCKQVASYLLVAGAGIAAFILIAEKKTQRVATNIVAAKELWKEWEKTSEAKPLESLEARLKKEPQLDRLYGAALGQRLIALDESKRARPYIEKAVGRSQLHPYYRSYASTTMLIEEKCFAQALEASLKLKEDLLKDKLFLTRLKENPTRGGALFGLNLLRIALLNEQLQDQQGEGKAWKDFEEYAGQQGLSKSMAEVVSHFTLQNHSLIDYIADRKERTKI